MNPADVTEWLVDKKKRGWRRRFRRRKTAHQPPTTQSQEKRGPKKMAEEWEKSAVWPSSETPPRAAHADETPLRFSCSLCRDARQYSPKDLVGHFEDRHAGIPPVFSCQMCAFSAHQFSYLQVHLLSHRDTFSSCAVCEDHVQRTWSEFRAHLTAQHCRDGQYSCAICRKFSTGDVGLFLEHAYAHHLTVDGRKAEADRFVLGAAAQTLRCQHCGYEVSRKLLINDDIHAVHICSGRNLARAKTGAPAPGAAKPDRSSPRVKLRLTRSAVREMCWLTQDCLSLPGREFLDKYCHLSDPHATLEETQEFLMQSVAGETADPKWTEALKSVLSNVPQGINLHPMSDHGKGSDSSDLAVLTVKNKITVAPNGAAYCKRLKSVTSAGKEPVPAGAVAHEGPAQNGRQSDFSNSGSSPRVGTRRGGGASGQSAPPERTQTPEDRKDGEDGSRMSSGLKLASERQATAPRRQRRRRRNVRRKGRAVRRKSAQKKAAGLPLKLLLKKNPVRGKQWVTQSCEGAPDARPGPEATPEETPRLLHHAMVAESCQRKGTKDSAERPGAEAGPQQTEPRAAEAGPGVRDPRQGGAEAELGSEVPPLRGPGGGVDPPDQRSAAADGGAAAGSSAEAAPPEPVITLQGQRTSGGLSLAVPSQRTSDGDTPADSGPGLGGGNSDLPIVKATQPEPAAAAGRWRRPDPKSLERTLKLVAISPYQRVRRPAGNQPVVVLNHPDADTPEVARIMEVINRYKGAVRKVALSRRTSSALSAAAPEVPKAQDPAGECDGRHSGCVQERFLLRLKLRRLSRKKYEVVGGASPRGGAAISFCCWFCGRVLASQETWVVHRQRHLMEWK